MPPRRAGQRRTHLWCCRRRHAAVCHRESSSIEILYQFACVGYAACLPTGEPLHCNCPANHPLLTPPTLRSVTVGVAL
eukprot:scaffold27178_cov56-Phaeocystis_antarctica.AAC.4